MTPGKATLVVRRRVVFGNRDIAELVVWRVPTPVPPTDHGFKYRLAYIVDGARVVGFDNERGRATTGTTGAWSRAILSTV